jgi:hypothetical protein
MEINNIIYGLAGLAIGGLGTSLWLGSKIKELKNTILDKRTVVMLLKEALKEIKPKKTYRKKHNTNGKKYRSTDGKTKTTRKSLPRKKYEKAS